MRKISHAQNLKKILFAICISTLTWISLIFFNRSNRLEAQMVFDKPIMIRSLNFFFNNGQFLSGFLENTPLTINSGMVEFEVLRGINEPDVNKTLTFGSWHDLEKVLSGTHPQFPYSAQDFHQAGITQLNYNIEPAGADPQEYQNLWSSDPATNSAAIFASIADNYGFSSLWAPIRAVADAIPDETISAMMQGGLDALGLQEQKFIETQCVADRVSAVDSTIQRYKSIAATRPFSFKVQIMATRCLNGDLFAQSGCPQETITHPYQHCELFVAAIANQIESLSVFAAPQDTEKQLDLIRSLRNSTVLPTLTPTPESSPSPTPSTSPSTTPAAKPGDANADGLVNNLDYVIWLAYLNQSVTDGATQADFNSNGITDGLDFSILIHNFSQPAISPTPSATPTGLTPTPTPGTIDTPSIPLAVSVGVGKDWFATWSKKDDILVTFGDNFTSLPSLSVGKVGWNVPSFAHVLETEAQWKGKINTIIYDYETWDKTPLEEQQNPDWISRTAQEYVNNNGLELIFGTSFRMVIKDGMFNNIINNPNVNWSEVIDKEKVQTIARNVKNYGSNATGLRIERPKDYIEFFKTSGQFAKEVNPDIRLWPVLDARNQTPEQMYQMTLDLAGYVDGVVIMGNAAQQTTISAYLNLMRGNL